jgi:hypothetical protein
MLQNNFDIAGTLPSEMGQMVSLSKFAAVPTVASRLFVNSILTFAFSIY